MDKTARLFHCVCCHSRVLICCDCDTGHIYCASSCAKEARRFSMLKAGARYQQTRRGKHHHAQRQKRYRARQQEKVTHHAYQTSTHHVVISLKARAQITAGAMPIIGDIYCHFCHQRCSPYVRVGFLRHSSRNGQVERLRIRDP